jgi:hypothetical protein
VVFFVCPEQSGMLMLQVSIATNFCLCRVRSVTCWDAHFKTTGDAGQWRFCRLIFGWGFQVVCSIDGKVDFIASVLDIFE